MTSTATHIVALSTTSIVGKEQWVHLLPTGVFDARDGRGPWSIDDPDAVIKASQAHARGNPLAVDYDHQIDHSPQNGKPALAAGWINRLETRADGIWGLIEWTATAAVHLARREYRFISPVFTYGTDKKIRAILRAGLTNAPALTLTALASESAPMDPIEEATNELRTLLGLDEAADMAAILAAVRALTTERASAVPPIDQYVPIATLKAVTAELQKLRKGVSYDTATAAVDAAIGAGRIIPALREWSLALCQENKPAFDSFISETGGSFAYLASEIVPGTRRASLTREHELDAAIGAQLGHSAEEMANTRKATR